MKWKEWKERGGVRRGEEESEVRGCVWGVGVKGEEKAQERRQTGTTGEGKKRGNTHTKAHQTANTEERQRFRGNLKSVVAC